VTHDRVHARRPGHRPGDWTEGVVRGLAERDGHAVFTVDPVPESTDTGGEAPPGPADPPDRPVDLTVTTAVRDLVLRRLDLPPDGSPVGERVWYRRHGGDR
jgi:hypothetical protein